MFAPLPIALGLAGTLALSDRSQALVRVPGTGDAHVSLDLETAPEARLMLSSRRMQYTLAYTPLFSLRDVGQGEFRGLMMNAATGRVEWMAERSRLSLEETAMYGSIDFSSTALAPSKPGQPPRLDVIPTPQVIRFASSRTTLASRLTLQRWAFDLSVGYQLSGGATEEARRAMPFQKGGFGQTSAEYRVTRRDFAATTFTASETSFSSGPEAILTQLDERWRHLLSRVTTTELALGASVARFRMSSTSSYSFETHPVAEGVLRNQFSAWNGRVDLRSSVGVAPLVNQLLGTIEERLQATVVATHTKKHLATRVLVTASESIPPSRRDATRLFASEVGAAWTPRGIVGFDAGLRGFYERAEATGADFFQGTLFVGITFRADPVRF